MRLSSSLAVIAITALVSLFLMTSFVNADLLSSSPVLVTIPIGDDDNINDDDNTSNLSDIVHPPSTITEADFDEVIMNSNLNPIPSIPTNPIVLPRNYDPSQRGICAIGQHECFGNNIRTCINPDTQTCSDVHFCRRGFRSCSTQCYNPALHVCHVRVGVLCLADTPAIRVENGKSVCYDDLA